MTDPSPSRVALGADKQPATAGAIYYPTTESFAVGVGAPIAPDVTCLAGSRPENGATDVPVETSIALRFSQPVRVTTLTTRTVTLAGPDRVVRAAVTPAEAGRLAFVTPASPLRPQATYTIAVSGVLANDGRGIALAPTGVTFTTAAKEDGTGLHFYRVDLIRFSGQVSSVGFVHSGLPAQSNEGHARTTADRRYSRHP